MYPDLEVAIYNRWGEKLFYSKGYDDPWDGTFQIGNGKALPAGTYYYVIIANKKVISGPVTILK